MQQSKLFDFVLKEANYPSNFDGLLVKKRFKTIDEIAIDFLNGCKFAFELEKELNNNSLREAEKKLFSAEEIEEIVNDYKSQLEYIKKLNGELLKKLDNGKNHWTSETSKQQIIQIIKDLQESINAAEEIKSTASKTQFELNRFIRYLKSRNLISDIDITVSAKSVQTNQPPSR